MTFAPTNAIDWEDAKRRIDQLGRTLTDSQAYTPEEAEAILHIRAQRLAELVDEPQENCAAIEVMIIGLAGERYAVETAVIREVIRLASLALLPGTARHVAGLMNLRGRPLMIVDARELLGLTCAQLSESARIVVIGGNQAEFGLLAEVTEEVAKVELPEMTEVPKTLPEATRRFVRGVTQDALIVLDSESLMNDPRLWIDDRED